MYCSLVKLVPTICLREATEENKDSEEWSWTKNTFICSAELSHGDQPSKVLLTHPRTAGHLVQLWKQRTAVKTHFWLVALTQTPNPNPSSQDQHQLLALTKPMSLAYCLKHWRHMLSPYLRIRPCRFEQTRLEEKHKSVKQHVSNGNKCDPDKNGTGLCSSASG